MDSHRVEQVLDAYVAAWNEADEAERRQLLEVALADEARFVGPTGTFTGREAIAGLIAGIRSRMPGASVLRTAPPELAGDIRFAWQVRSGDGGVVMQGSDRVELDGHGRLVLVEMLTEATGSGSG